MRVKKCNDEIKAARPTLEETKFIPKIPISFLLENIRSVHNVGSIFRTADGIGSKEIFLTGFTPQPPRSDLSKTALGAELSVPWSFEKDSISIAKKIKKSNTKLVILEHTKNSESIYKYDWEFPVCIILGNEVSGVSEDLVGLCDQHVEIPMMGIKQSLNVSVAAGVIGYEILRYYKSIK